MGSSALRSAILKIRACTAVGLIPFSLSNAYPEISWSFNANGAVLFHLASVLPLRRDCSSTADLKQPFRILSASVYATPALVESSSFCPLTCIDCMHPRCPNLRRLFLHQAVRSRVMCVPSPKCVNYTPPLRSDCWPP